ncbi:chondroitin AC/alginate lyase [Favolaschia claudopus]|uniref:Chondroitin AC/alginate lyase n=1 Tax=Favolaschia claudopus TaxID=2862362 RepID=A0AAW0CBD1_9AGAR
MFSLHLLSRNFPTAHTLLSLSLVLCLARAVLATNPFVQYAVDFPDPNFVASTKFGNNFNGAEATIVAWANEMASHGPWTVTSKPVVAPSGDKHDYMSWAPYEWPNCSNVKNTTALSLADESKKCNFDFRDGQVNPERFIIQDFQSFFNLSDAVLYNSIAAVLQNKPSSQYSQNVAKFVNTWFLDPNTAMNPNLNFAQMNRGPGGQSGAYTGILDLRGFAKIASGILMLRNTNNTDWTADLDSQFIAWCNKYIQWLDTAPNGQTAAHATNNHGTIFINQYAALKLIVKDTSSAVNWTQNYFNGLFQHQVNSSGNQPEEASRTHPYHYRNFNIAGMITNARLLKYANPSSTPWNATASGATIQTTIDFLMATDPNATGESDIKAEIYPNIAAIASVYGDPSGKYTGFLNGTGFAYADDPTFLWDQPLAGGDALASTNGTKGGPDNTKNAAQSSRPAEVFSVAAVSVLLILISESVGL